MKGGALKLSTKKSQIKFYQRNNFLVSPRRFERLTYSLEGCCSIQLSYGLVKKLRTFFLKRALKNLDFHWEDNHILPLRVKTTLHDVGNMVKKNLSKNVFVVKDEFRSEE